MKRHKIDWKEVFIAFLFVLPILVIYGGACVAMLLYKLGYWN